MPGSTREQDEGTARAHGPSSGQAGNLIPPASYAILARSMHAPGQERLFGKDLMAELKGGRWALHSIRRRILPPIIIPVYSIIIPIPLAVS